MSLANDAIIGGIEGGSSNSRMVLLNSKGTLLGYAEGGDTNQWLIGLKTATERLRDLVHETRKNAKIDDRQPISYLGLSLSGVDTEDNQKEFLIALKSFNPPLAKHIHIWNDSVGTLFTATDGGALVLISGTGSICNYIRPNLTFERIGGMGYLLGDGGSGYWIASNTILRFLEAEDGMIDVPYSLDQVRKQIYEHFSIDNSLALLPHFYEKFEKKKVAQLCEKLVPIARAGDEMLKKCFHDAGVQLGNHVRGALRRAAKDLSPANSVMVICCGSVFKCWDLLRPGFIESLNPKLSNGWKGVLQLVQLQCSAAYGAARLAAREQTGVTIPVPKNGTRNLDQIPFVIEYSKT